MSPPRIKTRLPFVAITVSAAVLVLAGIFLYRWVDRLSELDHRRQQEDLDASMMNLQREFAATLHEAVWFFHPIPEPRSRTPEAVYSELYSQWKNTARWPQLIDQVTIAFRSRGGKIVLADLHPDSGTFQDRPWPAELDEYRKSLLQLMPDRAARGAPEAGGLSDFLLTGGLNLNGELSLALPILGIRPAGAGRGSFARGFGAGHFPGARLDDSSHLIGLNPPPPLGGARSGLDEPLPPPGREPSGAGDVLRRTFVYIARRAGNSQLVGWCFLRFNTQFVRTRLLPFLIGQYFGSSGLAKYHVAVVTGNPQHIIYASDSGITTRTISSCDAKITLLRPHARLAPFAGIWRRRLPDRGEAVDARRELNPPSEVLKRWEERAGHDPASWQLVATDRRGSLAADVAAARWRNLAIGFATLLLLACSIAAMVVGIYRAHALAARQMEFVAGISHELRTPLAVIESAAFNLAKGKVEEHDRVQQYGEVIQTEGRRLSDLVEQTLAYSGVQAGRQHYQFKPTRILEVVNEALAEYDPLFSKMGWHVEKVIETSLPPVSADPPVLKSVIKNVIGNALKYASEGKWLRVTARAVESWHGTEVQLAIADHGPGIDPADLPHIFEPFYRGHRMVASPIAGAGLGLSLVNRHMQAHSGRVSVRSTNGSGAEFELHLPSL